MLVRGDGVACDPAGLPDAVHGMAMPKQVQKQIEHGLCVIFPKSHQVHL